MIMVHIRPGTVRYFESDEEEDDEDEEVDLASKTPLETQVTPLMNASVARSSERIRVRQSRNFRMPSTKDEMKKIADLESPSKLISSLKPRRLINDLMKVTHRYNHDADYTSGESSIEDFIDDDDDDDDYTDASTSKGVRISEKRKPKRKFIPSDDETDKRRTKIVAATEKIPNRKETDNEDENTNTSLKSRVVIPSSVSESSDVDQIGAKSSHKRLNALQSSDDDDDDHGGKDTETKTDKRSISCSEQTVPLDKNDYDVTSSDDSGDDRPQCSSDEDTTDSGDSDDSGASPGKFRSPRAALMQRRKDRQKRKFSKLIRMRKRKNSKGNASAV